jgi:lysyl-tRNA synthetase, class II
VQEDINQDLGVLIQRRYEELTELKKKGIEPFVYSYEVDSNTENIKSNFNEEEKRIVKIAGRIMAIRRMGKASFAHIQDHLGRIQIYLKKDDLGENYDVFRLLDIGDIIGVEGFIFKTKTGEISVHTSSLTLLAKSLRPLPIAKETVDEAGNKIVHDQFSDKELRYRQRYLDLLVNPNVKEVFVKRSKIISSIRKFLDFYEFMEVETPVLQPLYGGASARPFTTYHKALNTTLYLRIADELYLKRLIIGGLNGVYEISKDFRNEGMDKMHNPEFTMLELYVPYKDYEWMMSFVEKMISSICFEVFGASKFDFENNTVDFSLPWKRISLVDSLNAKIGEDILTISFEELKKVARKLNIGVDKIETKPKLIDELFSETVQKEITQPTFVKDYPLALSPLAKKHRTREGLVERFEGFVCGREICNAFSELNDPVDQKKRFDEQMKMREVGDEEAQQIDEEFLKALEYGMPPTAGLGIGIDRLVMLLTNQSSIRDVIFFPQMKTESKS